MLASESVPRELAWDDLIPKSWDPTRALAENDVERLEDSDPRAREAMISLRQAWDSAPVDATLHGTHARIPGFVVPLDTVSRNVTEFLLVPYFGACIHMPPPPANQIVHVLLRPGGMKIETMDAVWVSGVIETVQNQTWMGNSGYRIAAATVEPYREPRR